MSAVLVERVAVSPGGGVVVAPPLTSPPLALLFSPKSPEPDWAFVGNDLVRYFASCVLQSNGSFSDVLRMTQVCGAWRSALLDSPAEGLVKQSFALPKEVTSRFRYCSMELATRTCLGGQRPAPPGGVQMLINQRLNRHLPGRLPKLVDAMARWGSPSAALVVAMYMTEFCMASYESVRRRGRIGQGETWEKYKQICDDMGRAKDVDGSYSAEAMTFDLVHLWKRGARLGSKFCQAVLGEAFYCGGGVQLSQIRCIRDIEQAVLWLNKAVDHGEKFEGVDPMLARSELLLGYIFQDGESGEESYSDMFLYAGTGSYSEAVFWFRRAAKHGSIEAQQALSSLYSTGQY